MGIAELYLIGGGALIVGFCLGRLSLRGRLRRAEGKLRELGVPVVPRSPGELGW